MRVSSYCFKQLLWTSLEECLLTMDYFISDNFVITTISLSNRQIKCVIITHYLCKGYRFNTWCGFFSGIIDSKTYTLEQSLRKSPLLFLIWVLHELYSTNVYAFLAFTFIASSLFQSDHLGIEEKFP